MGHKVENRLLFANLLKFCRLTRCLQILTKHMKNSNKSHQLKQLYASYEIHNLFHHSLKATNAKLSRERSEVTKCIGVQVSQLIYVSLNNMSLRRCKYNRVISPDKIRNERVPCILFFFFFFFFFFFIQITSYIILKTYEPRREKTGLLGFRPGATQKQATVDA